MFTQEIADLGAAVLVVQVTVVALLEMMPVSVAAENHGSSIAAQPQPSTVVGPAD